MEVFKKTAKYCLYRLALGGICLGVCTLLFAILFAIGRAINADEVTAVLMLLWFIAAAAFCYLSIGRYGCKLRVGHLAAMSEYLLAGELPTEHASKKTSLYAFGAEKLTARFATLNEALSCERACHAALSELSALFARLPASGDKSSSTSGTKRGQTPAIFVEIALGYVAQSCLGYVFYNETVNCRKAVAEGVIVYSRFNRRLQKNSFGVALIVIISTVLLFALLFVALLLLLRVFELTRSLAPFSAFVFAAVITCAVKFAVTDSILLAAAFTRYLALAPDAEINTEAFGRLCSASAKYRAFYASARKLPDPPALDAADTDESSPPVTEYDENALRKYTGDMPAVKVTGVKGNTQARQGKNTHQTRSVNRQTAAPRPSAAANTSNVIFCSECGAKNPKTAKFCANCGERLA